MNTIDEIILRVHTDEGMRYVDKLKSLIDKEWYTRVKIIDNRDYCFADFGLEDFCWMNIAPVSLDKHLAQCLEIPYLQISRVFFENGAVAFRRIGQYDFKDNSDYKHYVIDTDMVNGDTIKLACRILNTDSYSVPIKVKPNQDLIDVEDLFMDNSLLQTHAGVKPCNYLLNYSFFTKRTSLPPFLYSPISELFK